ncbi:MAG: VanZ family protein [Thermoplasmata archaeon]
MRSTWKHASVITIWVAIAVYAGFIFQLSSAPIQAQPPPIQATYQAINETVRNTVILPTGQPPRYTPDYLHLFLYIVFGMLLYFGFIVLGAKARHFAINLAWLSGTFYALTDEYHQSFVPGRTSDWKDAVADATGVLVGIFLAILFINLALKVRKRLGSPWDAYLGEV